jgi:aryl-alcohol dehydrogenase-like predicted oxidoreductase
MSKTQSRRDFCRVAGAALALAACGRHAGAETSPSPSAPSPGDEPPDGPTGSAGPAPDEFDVPDSAAMPTRPLGRTGAVVSVLGIGGFHLGLPHEQEAIRIVREAIDHGVTFLDNCWDYNGGESERRMGKALEDGYRDRAFLMTKIDGRTAEAAARQLDQSLARLRTDHVDLVQVHEVIRDTDPGRVFGEGGAIEALARARDAGKTRFIGFTGHKSPAIHLAMLDEARRHGFRFDTVQMPLNVMDPHYESFETEVLPVLSKDQIGVLGMKPLGSGIILQSRSVSPTECLRYAMSLPTSVVITGCDTIGVLRQALHVALTFEPMTDKHRRALLERTATAGGTGAFEQYKNSQRFDGTAHHPEWLD